MKEIKQSFYKRYLGTDRYLTVEVIDIQRDERQPWQKDERLTAISMYKRKAGIVMYRIGQNQPIKADLYQVKYDELPESEWYEYFTAGMSDIHPNDIVSN